MLEQKKIGLQKGKELNGIDLQKLMGRLREKARRKIPEAEVEDLVQEVMVVLVKRLRTEKVEALHAYSDGILRHMIYDFYQRRREQMSSLDGFEADTGAPTPEQRVVWRRHLRVIDGMAEENPVDKALVSQHFKEGAPLREVASNLGVSAGVVNGRLFRFRQKLLQRVGSCFAILFAFISGFWSRLGKAYAGGKGLTTVASMTGTVVAGTMLFLYVDPPKTDLHPSVAPFQAQEQTALTNQAPKSNEELNRQNPTTTATLQGKKTIPTVALDGDQQSARPAAWTTSGIRSQRSHLANQAHPVRLGRVGVQRQAIRSLARRSTGRKARAPQSQRQAHPGWKRGLALQPRLAPLQPTVLATPKAGTQGGTASRSSGTGFVLPRQGTIWRRRTATTPSTSSRTGQNTASGTRGQTSTPSTPNGQAKPQPTNPANPNEKSIQPPTGKPQGTQPTTPSGKPSVEPTQPSPEPGTTSKKPGFVPGPKVGSGPDISSPVIPRAANGGLIGVDKPNVNPDAKKNPSQHSFCTIQDGRLYNCTNGKKVDISGVANSSFRCGTNQACQAMIGKGPSLMFSRGGQLFVLGERLFRSSDDGGATWHSPKSIPAPEKVLRDGLLILSQNGALWMIQGSQWTAMRASDSGVFEVRVHIDTVTGKLQFEDDAGFSYKHNWKHNFGPKSFQTPKSSGLSGGLSEDPDFAPKTKMGSSPTPILLKPDSPEDVARGTQKPEPPEDVSRQGL